jgi:hypothetical protein
MSTAVSAGSAPSRLLRRALGGNGLFSLSSGLVCLLWAEPLTRPLGIPSVPLLRVIGLVLIGYSGFLLWLASRPTGPTGPTPLRRMALLASALDAGWVIGSGVLLVLPAMPWTTLGRWVIGGLAVIVAGWGLIQLSQLIGLTRPQAVER